MIAIEVGIRVDEVDIAEVEQVVYTDGSDACDGIPALDGFKLCRQLVGCYQRGECERYVVVHGELFCGGWTPCACRRWKACLNTRCQACGCLSRREMVVLT